MIEAWLKDKLRGDWQIWFIVMVLSLFSILVVYSASSALAYKRVDGNTELFLLSHSLHILMGFAVIWFVHRLNYTTYAGFAKLFLWLSPLLLLYTYRYGVNIGGVRRWISILGISFQTSDLVRLALITNLAALLAPLQNQRPESYPVNKLWTLIVWCGLICGMLALSNFSTAAILGLTCFIIMWIGRVPNKYLFRLAATVVVMLFLTVLMSVVLHRSGIEFGRGRTVVERVESFIHKDLDGDNYIGNKDREDNDYQRDQAMIAIARGGIIGIGPGNSFQRNYLPEAFSDYIYAIIVEEYGLIGGVIVMVFYLWLLYRGLKNVENTKRAFGGLLCVGLTFSIVFQAFAHMVINVGMGPVTGQPLPLMSMGGTSILFTSVAIGIVLSVSKGEYDEKGIK